MSANWPNNDDGNDDKGKSLLHPPQSKKRAVKDQEPLSPPAKVLRSVSATSAADKQAYDDLLKQIEDVEQDIKDTTDEIQQIKAQLKNTSELVQKKELREYLNILLETEAKLQAKKDYLSQKIVPPLIDPSSKVRLGHHLLPNEILTEFISPLLNEPILSIGSTNLTASYLELPIPDNFKLSTVYPIKSLPLGPTPNGVGASSRPVLRILVRDCYFYVFEKLKDLQDPTKHPDILSEMETAVVTGTPGIGKSHSFSCFQILLSSPRRQGFGHFLKYVETPARLVLPPFTRDELKQFGKMMEYHEDRLNDAIILFEVFGGVPRYCYENAFDVGSWKTFINMFKVVANHVSAPKSFIELNEDDNPGLESI